MEITGTPDVPPPPIDNEEESWKDIRLSEPVIGEESSVTTSETETETEAETEAGGNGGAAAKPSAGWFPGKFIKEAKKKISNKSNVTDQTEGSSVSNIDVTVDNDPSDEIGGTTKTTNVKDQAELCKPSDEEEDEETKKEATIVATVRAIRAKYLERQLVGKIFIKRLSGVITTAVTSFVTAEHITEYLLNKVERDGDLNFLQDDLMLRAEKYGSYKRALSTTDTILNSLERRSVCWQSSEFGVDTMLTRGTILGVSDPFVGLIGFSITLELSATSTSLLASRKRYEVVRELAESRNSTITAEEEAARLSASVNGSNVNSIFSAFFGGKKAAVAETAETAESVDGTSCSADHAPLAGDSDKNEEDGAAIDSDIV